MTEKDSILLREANAACYLEWSEVYDLAEQAESREVREEILARGRFLRHLDEAVHDTI